MLIIQTIEKIEKNSGFFISSGQSMIKFWNFEAIRKQLTVLRLVNKSKNIKN